MWGNYLLSIEKFLDFLIVSYFARRRTFSKLIYYPNFNRLEKSISWNLCSLNIVSFAMFVKAEKRKILKHE
jgi:hypothetical protein